jgi:non-heme chloroperoxidase
VVTVRSASAGIPHRAARRWAACSGIGEKTPGYGTAWLGTIQGVQVNRFALSIVTLGVLIAYPVWAQSIAGDWQGTIGEGRKFRVVLKIMAAADGNLSANLYSIDQSSAAIPVEAFTLNASVVTFGAPIIRGSYKGTLSADGAGISGLWTQPNGEHVLNFVRATKDTAWALDQAPHTAKFVEVDSGVKLEVLDWGGTGRSLVLLAGLGNNAHVFDLFAPKLKAKYHVYAITRRGFGASDSPVPTDTNYSANRLGDDVIAVLDTLKLTHPVLVGHSRAGEELSSIGTRYPDRVAGLVYLDAGYHYAIYDGTQPDFLMDRLELLRKLTAIGNAISPQEEKQLLAEIAARLPTFESAAKSRQKELADKPDMMPEAIAEERKRRQSREGISARAVQDGEQAFAGVRCPVLAVFAVPHQYGRKQDADADAKDIARVEPLVKVFEKAMPQATIVRIPHANHYVFTSHEAEVLREIDQFVSRVKE